MAMNPQTSPEKARRARLALVAVRQNGFPLDQRHDAGGDQDGEHLKAFPHERGRWHQRPPCPW